MEPEGSLPCSPDHHWSLSWARWIQSIPSNPVSLRCVLMLSSHLPSCLRMVFALQISNQNVIWISHLSLAFYMPTQVILFWVDHPSNIGEVHKLWSSSLCSLLQPPALSSHWGPNILLSTLYINTLNLCSSRSVRNQVNWTVATIHRI